jgi:hypothetical protein
MEHNLWNDLWYAAGLVSALGTIICDPVPSPAEAALAERHDHTAGDPRLQGLHADHPARVAERTRLALEVFWTCYGFENASGAARASVAGTAAPAWCPTLDAAGRMIGSASFSYGYDAAALMTGIIMGWTLPSIRAYEVRGSQKLVRVLKRFYHKNHPVWGYLPGAWPRKK